MGTPGGNVGQPMVFVRVWFRLEGALGGVVRLKIVYVRAWLVPQVSRSGRGVVRVQK